MIIWILLDNDHLEKENNKLPVFFFFIKVQFCFLCNINIRNIITYIIHM